MFQFPSATGLPLLIVFCIRRECLIFALVFLRLGVPCVNSTVEETFLTWRHYGVCLLLRLSIFCMRFFQIYQGVWNSFQIYHKFLSNLPFQLVIYDAKTMGSMLLQHVSTRMHVCWGCFICHDFSFCKNVSNLKMIMLFDKVVIESSRSFTFFFIYALS